MSLRVFGICELLIAALALSACGDGDGSGGDGGADTDSDSDSDSDTDTDSDSGADGGTDTETDECVEEDVFDPAACPEIDSSDPKVRFVDVDAADPGDGMTWGSAFETAQPALDACRCVALALGASCQVWVAAGDYVVASPSCRTDTIRLRPGVELYGGFTGGESALEERDFETNVTILDGGGFTYHVVTGADDARIDGFTITDGFAYGVGEGQRSGAGMYNVDASPIVANCRFTYGYAGERGGGMYNDNASPIVTGCRFEGNRSEGSGGGMTNDYGTPIVTDCTFAGNSAEGSGGGMLNDGASAVVTGCSFSDNTAGGGGGMANRIGSPTVTDCTFLGNDAESSGGGMFNSENSPIVTSCTFSGNGAYGDEALGGGMSNDGSSPVVTNCRFYDNEAWYGSGGMANTWSSSSIITSCTFTGNEGGVSDWESSSTVRNSVVWGNEYVDVVAYDDTYSEVPSTSSFQNSDVGGCGGGGAWNTDCGADLGGNIDADPMFADAAGGDYSPMSGSPCIDTGDNALLPADLADLDGDLDTDEPLSLDLAFDPRVTDGDGDSTATVDMGAYEFQP